MIHIEDVDKIDEKYLDEFKTKSFYEIVEKYRTDKQISKKKKIRFGQQLKPKEK